MAIRKKIPQSIIDKIPNTTNERNAFIVKNLASYKNHYIKSKDLNSLIFVSTDSIEEIAYHAAKRKESTIMALYISDVVKTAKKVKENLKPKEGKQTKVFHFEEIKILQKRVSGLGTAKLTVGKNKQGLEAYCLTHIRFTK